MKYKTWLVQSNCISVRVTSRYFDLAWNDFLTIDGVRYSGKTEFDQIINGPEFEVQFTSGAGSWTRSGFEIEWKCVQTIEWSCTSLFYGSVVCDNDFTVNGNNCNDWGANNWCTIDGDYGSGWDTTLYGTFADYPDPITGLTALSCSVCGCKDPCCEEFQIVTDYIDNQIYRQSGNFVEDIPVYVDESGLRAVWSRTGQHPWNVGNLTDLDNVDVLSAVNVLEEHYSICKISRSTHIFKGNNSGIIELRDYPNNKNIVWIVEGTDNQSCNL